MHTRTYRTTQWRWKRNQRQRRSAKIRWRQWAMWEETRPDWFFCPSPPPSHPDFLIFMNCTKPPRHTHTHTSARILIPDTSFPRWSDDGGGSRRLRFVCKREKELLMRRRPSSSLWLCVWKWVKGGVGMRGSVGGRKRCEGHSTGLGQAVRQWLKITLHVGYVCVCGCVLCNMESN